MGFFSKKQDTFCALPFSHLSISPDGKQRVCCNNNTYPTLGGSKEVISVNASSFDLKSAFNNELHRSLRVSMLNGEQHPSCNRCWEIEKGGGESYRTAFNRLLRTKTENEIVPKMGKDGTIAQPKFFYIEMTFGNKCNLRCRMCNPWSSVQWLKEAKELGFWNIDQNTFSSLEKFSWFEDEKARQLLVKGLEFADRLNFLGGEPLLIKEHLQLLEECISVGRAKEINIQYNTNLTYIPENIRELWKQFKSVELNLSCDGYKELNEYIRFPVKWDSWVQNVKTIAEWRTDVNLQLSLHSTFQSLNVTRLPEFYDWTWEFMTSLELPRIPFVIYVTQPDYFDPRHLPREVKSQVIKKHNAYFERMEKQNLTHIEQMWLSMIKGHIQTFATQTENSEKLWKNFLMNTVKVDQSRKQSVTNVLPEFQEYFNTKNL